MQSELVQGAQDREEADAVARQPRAFVAPRMNGWSRSSLRSSRSVADFGVGAGDDDAGHAHDVELEPGGVEALDLLVLGDEDLAVLVAALLRAGLLVLDVIAGHADLDEAADQVAHVGVAAVARCRRRR